MNTFITYYVETNLICIMFVAFVIFTYARDSHGLTEAKWFLSALVTVQIYCVADVLAAVFKNKTFTGARTILWISNIIYIIIPLILVVFWNLFIREHVRPYYEQSELVQLFDKVITSAAIAICVLSVFTPLTHSLFYLDEMNGYHRGFGAYGVPLFSYIFMIYETIKLQLIKRKNESLQVKHDLTILSLFAAPCILFSLIQVLLYGTTIAQVGFTMGLMIVYLGRQKNKVSRDELTGLNNRREFNYAIDRMTRIGGTAMIAMIDVNEFKSINDTYGHQEGDTALRGVALILRNACSDRKNLGNIALYRYGGDEFTLISNDLSNENIKENLINAINDETKKWNEREQKPYSLSMSAGIAVGEYSGKDIYNLIEAADKEMYAVKEERKKKLKASKVSKR